MKRKQITLKGWANTSDLLCSENSTNDEFLQNFRATKVRLLSDGFKEVNTAFHNLRGKNASEKVVIKGWYWRGSWCDPIKATYTVFYK